MGGWGGAHLSKGLVRFVLEPLDLLKAAHVRGDYEHVLLADFGRDLASEVVYVFRVDVGEDDPQP